MTQLTFGKTNKLNFKDEHEFFFTLGFLASKRRTSFTWEDNHIKGNAWGPEGRIHCLKDLDLFPTPLKNKFTKGTGSILKRINCNEYVKYLSKNHSIYSNNIEDIASTVPPKYLNDFFRGLNL